MTLTTKPYQRGHCADCWRKGEARTARYELVYGPDSGIQFCADHMEVEVTDGMYGFGDFKVLKREHA